LRRRDFIALLGSGIVDTLPMIARAQQTSMPVIGFLSSRSPGESANVLAAFREGLRETGFVEGQNAVIAFRWAEGRYDRLPALAAELVALRVAAIFAAGGPAAALAAKAATSTIPVVFSSVTDPVQLGLVASLSRPGANVTGMSNLTDELWAKNVQLLKELVPTASTVGYLVNPSTPASEIYLKGAKEGSSATGIDVRVLKASTETEIDEAFASIVKLGAGGLVVPNEPFFDSRRDRIIALSARYTVPTIYTIREYPVAGGLMSYGPSLSDSYRKAAAYLGRILKGEKPADLPVQQPTKFDLVINLTTAKALGLTVSPTLLARADEVIE
jgi:putative tryptophan/tyrosine transport system substrate-binding protein